MSINVSMRKNGENWNENIDKLNVPAGIGSNNWVPASASNLVKMTIGENGTYNASDYGAGGISEAYISQSGHHATSTADSSAQKIHEHVTTIPEGGNSKYINGIKRVRVNSGNGTVDLYNQQDVGLTTLYVSTPGKYKAADQNAYGFSKIEVAFPSGGDSGDDGGWDNAFDGQGLPDEIRVTTPPTKSEYEDGETIDYTGMVVKAYKSGVVWENSSYPSGIIPLNELTGLPTTVDFKNLLVYGNNSELYPSGFSPWKSPVHIACGGSYYRKYIRNYSSSWYDERIITYQLSDGVGITGIYFYDDNALLWCQTIICGSDKQLNAGVVITEVCKKNGEIVRTKTYNGKIDSISGSCIYQNNETSWNGGNRYNYYVNNGAKKFVLTLDSTGGLGPSSGDLFTESNIPGIDSIYTSSEYSTLDTILKKTQPFRGLYYGDVFANAVASWARPGDKMILSTQIPITINLEE